MGKRVLVAGGSSRRQSWAGRDTSWTAGSCRAGWAPAAWSSRSSLEKERIALTSGSMEMSLPGVSVQERDWLLHGSSMLRLWQLKSKGQSPPHLPWVPPCWGALAGCSWGCCRGLGRDLRVIFQNAVMGWWWGKSLLFLTGSLSEDGKQWKWVFHLPPPRGLVGGWLVVVRSHLVVWSGDCIVRAAGLPTRPFPNPKHTEVEWEWCLIRES